RPGDVEDRRKLVLRSTEAIENDADSLEPEAVTRGRELGQTIKLRLDARMRRAREIGHQAASLTPGVRYETRRASVSLRSPRETTMSIMPCSSRYSARWKPSGSFSRIVCSITLWPAKPIRAPGSASWTSPSIA